MLVADVLAAAITKPTDVLVAVPPVNFTIATASVRLVVSDSVIFSTVGLLLTTFAVASRRFNCRKLYPSVSTRPVAVPAAVVETSEKQRTGLMLGNMVIASFSSP